MSDNDDPFGRRERTIIRPNPGGRRPSHDAGRRAARRDAQSRRSPIPASAVRRPMRRRPPMRRLLIRRRISRRPKRSASQLGRLGDIADAAAGQSLYAAGERFGADDAGADFAARLGRSRRHRRQSADARRGLAAAAARAPARLAVARGDRPVDGSGRPIDRAVRDRCARGGRSARTGQRPPNMRSPRPPTTSCRTCRPTIGICGRNTACSFASSASAPAA